MDTPPKAGPTQRQVYLQLVVNGLITGLIIMNMPAFAGSDPNAPRIPFLAQCGILFVSIGAGVLSIHLLWRIVDRFRDRREKRGSERG